jgi:hypothetical protein
MPLRSRSLLLLLTLLGASSGPAAAAAPVRDGSTAAVRLLATSGRSGGTRPAVDPLTGPRSRLPKDWIGLRALPPDTPILVMAGHADSQNLHGSGTTGAAVALGGAAPMMRGISDELYWNILVAREVVRIGRQRGLSIRYHSPPSRTIHDHDHPGTNWTEGRRHADAGGYALEIHFDAYGPDGVGSGLIPAAIRPFTTVDETLAEEFGAFPMQFRNVLGGPRRGISLLEVGKLEGRLEASLRDSRSRAATVGTIAERVVGALERGLGRGDRLRPGTAALR